MKRLNYKVKLHFGILYFILIISIVTNIISNKNIIGNKIHLIKNMEETTEVSNLNNTINTLQASHTEYSNYIQKCKEKLATAITEKGVETLEEDGIDTMVNNIKNIIGDKDSYKIVDRVEYSGARVANKSLSIILNKGIYLIEHVFLICGGSGTTSSRYMASPRKRNDITITGDNFEILQEVTESLSVFRIKEDSTTITFTRDTTKAYSTLGEYDYIVAYK